MAIKPVNRELALAIDNGDGAGVLQALAAGADPNTSVGGKDMLYRAWKERRHQIFQVLMESGARMQGRNKGREGLFLARSGWLELLGSAVEQGWEMEVETPEAVSEQRTVAAELARQGNRDGLLMLDRLGVDIRKGEISPIRSPGRWRCTLAIAITENTHIRHDGLEHLLDVLLVRPPRDENDCLDVGQALGEWVRGREQAGDQIARLLHVLRESTWWTPHTVGSMAASMACFSLHPALVKQLATEMPAIMDPMQSESWMPSSLLMSTLHGLRSASCKNPRDMLNLVHDLLAMGADPNHRFHGQTMAHCLMLGDGKCSDSDFKALDALIGAGADLMDVLEVPAEDARWGYREPTSKNWHGSTMAHAMAWEMQIVFRDAPIEGASHLRQLIEREPRLLAVQDQNGLTPLHSAMLPRSCMRMLSNQRQCLPMLEMLLEQGADPLATWREGNTMLHAIASAWEQGLKPSDGDRCLAFLKERAPQLWEMTNDEGVTGQEALDAINKPVAVAGPARKR